MTGSATTQPPDRLATRVGGSAEGYREIARFHREHESAAVRWGWIVSLLGLLCAAGLAGFALVRRRRASASS